MQPPAFDKELSRQEFNKMNSVRRLLGQYHLWFLLFLGSMVFHGIARGAFYLWNLKNFSDSTWTELLWAVIWGLRFDISASLALWLPTFLAIWGLAPFISKRGLQLLVGLNVLIFAIPMLALNFVDIEMVNIVGRRFSWQTLFILREAQGKFMGFFASYGGIILTVLFILGLAAVLAYRAIFRFPEVKLSKWNHFALGFPLLILIVIGGRGGVQAKPLSFVHAQLFQNHWLNLLVINSSFSVLKSIDKEGLRRFQFFQDPQEKFKILTAGRGQVGALHGHRPLVPQNVVIIILESFGAEYLNQGFTPFLDSLTERSVYFSQGIANGRRSIEGVPAILTGVPTLSDEPFITSPFATNKVPKLPEILKQKNYHTSFFHGGNNGTMYFDSFTQGLGVDHYFGAREYPNKEDHDGTWGIYDGPFFQFFAQKLSGFPEPFFSTFFSLSSHQPYKIPDTLAGQFPEGPLPILKAIAYTDDSLKKFFETVKTAPWYSRTLFVVTADHTQISYRPEFQNDISKYKIPVLFFHPQFQWPVIKTEQIVQQIDIPASILDFLGLDPDLTLPLSRSAFVEGPRTAVTYLDGRYLLISPDYFLSGSVESTLQMYARDDEGQKNPLTEPAFRKAALEKQLKAVLEYFSQGMLDNRLLTTKEIQ